MLVILSGHKFKFVLKFGPWAISTTTSHKIVEETRKITSTFNYIKTKEHKIEVNENHKEQERMQRILINTNKKNTAVSTLAPD